MQIHPEQHKGQLNEKQLLNVVDDLCHFILHEVVNVRSKYFFHEQELEMDDKFISLHEWDKQAHHAGSNSVNRE